MLSYEGRTIEDLKHDFEDSVDEYLEICKRYGWTPEKTSKEYYVYTVIKFKDK
ncbi:HicB protein [Ligilactobacillus equi DPC 6820]|uniref:HicB protein n=1 Tax=Ligilactobacillus equi DPC 6820 TaxID=1392007 RepID=V7HZA3_9LACO|nr:HicB protein [Ligilactobacillus equi DPC 6820]